MLDAQTLNASVWKVCEDSLTVVSLQWGHQWQMPAWVQAECSLERMLIAHGQSPRPARRQQDRLGLRPVPARSAYLITHHPVALVSPFAPLGVTAYPLRLNRCRHHLSPSVLHNPIRDAYVASLQEHTKMFKGEVFDMIGQRL